MNMIDKFQAITQANNSLVCVGLDSDTNRIPEGYDQFAFNKAIVDATHDLVCAYKPNTAFYEAEGADGIDALKFTCDYIRKQYPNIPIILDAKRADIGNTNTGYTRFAFDYLGVDAVTIHPYLGSEAIQPFLDHKDKGIIVLCRTSNPGAAEFQDVVVDGAPLYETVAHQVVEQWNSNKNCMLVVGATYPTELARIREIAGNDMWFLVPGVGAQGGDVEKTVKAGVNNDGAGIIVNSSREIIFASSEADFADVARAKTTSLRDNINSYR